MLWERVYKLLVMIFFITFLYYLESVFIALTRIFSKHKTRFLFFFLIWVYGQERNCMQLNYNNNNTVMLTDSSLLFIETPRIYSGEKKKNKGKISKTKIWRDQKQKRKKVDGQKLPTTE